MMHPDTELRFVSEVVGYGVHATRFIPRGTITWTGDELDQRFDAKRLETMHPLCRAQVARFSYTDPRGMFVLCWDHGRYVNHSCDPNCLSSGFDFEFAIRDIQPGEQMTDEYGLMNLAVRLQCRCGAAQCRGTIGREDVSLYGDVWDRLAGDAFPSIAIVAQPLWPLVAEKSEIDAVLQGRVDAPSCRFHCRESSGDAAVG